MLYRFTQKNTSEFEMLDLMERGVKLDFDKLWGETQPLSKWADKKPERYFQDMKYADTFEKVFSVIECVTTLGIFPALDTLYYVSQKRQKKVQDKEDAERDIIAVPADEIIFFGDRIKEKVSKLVKQGHKVNVVVDGCAQFDEINSRQRIEYNFDTTKLLKLWDLNYELQKLGMTGSIKFNEFFKTTKYTDLKTCWNLEQVIDANNEIDKVVTKIQTLKLSPYEAMVYIHKYLTQNYGYGFNGGRIADKKDTRKSENNRSIVAAIRNKQTICSGYASMTKAIVDRLKMPRLTCEYLNTAAWKIPKDKDPEFLSGHALNLVTIDDSKYNINGSYLNDATWDSKTKKCPRGRGYSFFMYPITDMVDFRTRPQLSVLAGSRAHIQECPEFGQLPTKAENSYPIPYDMLEKAVKNVYSLESDFCENGDAVKTAREDLLLSLRKAWNTRFGKTNLLVKQIDRVYTVRPTWNKKGELKKVKFELKNKAINSDMEMS